jgi:hypothetical protein
MLDYNAASAFPVNLDVLGEVDLHQHEVVFVFREKAENFTACHQFAGGRKDDAKAEVAFVPSNFDAEEVKNGMIFSTQWKYTEQ